MPKSSGPRTPARGLSPMEHEHLASKLRHVVADVQNIRAALGCGMGTASEGYREASTVLNSLKRLQLKLAEELVMSAEVGDPAVLEVRALYLGEA
jgi:hypothetical protein